MPSVGLIPALSLLAGAAAGSFSGLVPGPFAIVLPLSCGVSVVSWLRRMPSLAVASLAAGFGLAGAALASDARQEALSPGLRSVLDAHVGEFDIRTLGPERDHDPIPTRAVLNEDAAVRDGFVSLRARVIAVAPRDNHWLNAPGGVSLSVSGDAAAPVAVAWRAGRTIEVPVSFRRPARYLNEGVPDFEYDLALDGTTLFGSVKSGLMVTVVGRGSLLEEAAADLRAYVRRAVDRWVAPHDPVAAGVVTAVLIGDRTGLPLDVRERLQAAGTYHVIAISGGNIAILAGLVVLVLMAAGIRGRPSALITIAVLLFYTLVAAAGPSVWRATMMAVVYFGARVLDHRTSPWQAASVAAALMVAVRPLEVRDPGFVLTFGATAALLQAARLGRARLPRRRAAAWIAASVGASLATEVALLPVSAQAFSRVTSAGLFLNLIAVPMMGVAQIAGLAVVALGHVDTLASVSGWTAYIAARALIESSTLVDVAPWLTMRVPAPGTTVLGAYYLSLAVALFAKRRVRLAGGAGLVVSLALITGLSASHLLPPPPSDARFRWTVFDVGQAEAMLVQLGGKTLQIDAGGAPFGNSSFDMGARVLAPALWAQRLRSLDALLITHGDPDHIGGARAIGDAFSPAQLWEGIEVPAHAPMRELRDAIRSRRGRIDLRRAGESFHWNGARIRVLHPPEPDWERPRVRNDDSVVLEIVYGEVGVLLTGDISADVEREIAPRLSRTPIRILKVAHHGSRTSTSRELLDAWRPQYAVISAGRGNTFGHPAPDVLRRLESIGARVFRTDLHGQITLETDGRRMDVHTYVPRDQTKLDR
jgi:competence protein ComEC